MAREVLLSATSVERDVFLGFELWRVLQLNQRSGNLFTYYWLNVDVL